MKRKLLTKGILVLPVLSLLVAMLPVLPASAAGEGIRQKLAMPAYFHALPDGDTGYQNLWDDVESASGADFGFAVANPVSGPDNVTDSDINTAFSVARGNGTKILGYVDTGYFGRFGATTRDNQTSVGAWRSQVQADINAWYSLYSGNIDGIYLDNMDTECGTGNATVRNYWHARTYIEQTYRGALTVGNPGTAVPSCYESAADTLVTFEGSYDCYQLAGSCPSADQYTTLSWTNSDPYKFMHIINNTASGDVADALADSKTNRAGYVYVTDDSGDEPYDTIPSYLSTELSAMPANGTSDTTAPTLPSSLTVSATDYTTVDLSWTKSTDGGSGVAAYEVRDSGTGKLLETKKATSSTTQTTTVTGLANNTSYNFVVRARDGSGNETADTSAVNVTTLSDPMATPWSAPSQPTATNTTYTSVDLNWNHATGGSWDKAFYEVLQDGVPIQKITSADKATHITGLAPNTTYSFTVRLGDSAGYTWSQSTARSVTTTALPGGGAISSETGDLTGSDVTFEGDFNYSWGKHRVYIDVDSDPSTGYEAYFGAQIGADYIIEDGKLYQSNTNDPVWDVTEVTSSGMTYSPPTTTATDKTHTWAVPLSALGSPSVSSMDFELEGIHYGTYAMDGPFTAL